MHPLRRLLRHWRTPRATGTRTFPPATLRDIKNLIDSGATMHRAHLHVAIETNLPMTAILRRDSSRQRACRLFSTHHLWDTTERTGVLIYLNLADRQVEIVADHGVSSVLNSAQWSDLCHQITQGFADGRFHIAMLDALQTLNLALQKQLPRERTDSIP